MLRPDHLPRTASPDTVSDLELGLAAVMVGVLVLLATILVPLIG